MNTAIVVEKNAPLLVDHYEGLWRRFLHGLEAFRIIACETDGDARTHSENFSYALNCWEVASEKAASLREAIVRELVQLGELEFAPKGGHLKIEAKELEKAGAKIVHNDFSPITIWQEIEDRFGGTTGVERAWEDAAKAIVTFFHYHTRHMYHSNPTADEQVKDLFMDKGKYVLLKSGTAFDHSSWTMDNCSAGYGKPDHEAQRRYYLLCKHLETVSSATDLGIIDSFASNDLTGTVRREHDTMIKFGTRVDWRTTSVIFRKDTTEWHMRHNHAEALREFLIANYPPCKEARKLAERGETDAQA